METLHIRSITRQYHLLLSLLLARRFFIYTLGSSWPFVAVLPSMGM